jgi:uncharacterized membrane protein YGL010W
MKKVDSLLADYAFYHRTRGNKACHFVGIPLIIYALFILLRPLILVPPLTSAELLIVLSVAYYLILDTKLAIGMLLILSLLDFAAFRTPDPQVGIAAMIIGWIFQTIGHVAYEKRSPAFFRNLVHLLIGPLFLLNDVLHVRPVEAAPA